MDVSLSGSLVAGGVEAGRTRQLNTSAQESKAAERLKDLSQPLEAESVTDPELLNQAVSSIESFVQSIRRDLSFAMDESTGRMVVKVTDGASGEVIRQMPSEEALRLAASLEEVRSLLFKAEA